MTRGEAIRHFLVKSILPMASTLLLVCIFKSACMKNGTLDYVWLVILCGLPFGMHRMCLWVIPGNRSFGVGVATFAFNFIIGGVIGGVVLIWHLLVAAWYVPRISWPPSLNNYFECTALLQSISIKVCVEDGP